MPAGASTGWQRSACQVSSANCAVYVPAATTTMRALPSSVSRAPSTPVQLTAIPVQPGMEVVAALHPDDPDVLPPGALALFIEMRAQMHVLVLLEIVGERYPYGAHGAALFAGVMHRMSENLDALQRAAQ